MDGKGALKLNSRRAGTCPREQKSVELLDIHLCPLAIFNNLRESRLVSVANLTAIKEADTLVVTDEKTSKLNHAV